MHNIFYNLQDNLSMSYEDFTKLSKEELYRILPRVQEHTCPQCGAKEFHATNVTSYDVKVECEKCYEIWRIPLSQNGTPIPMGEFKEDLKIPTPNEGITLQEGDPELYGDGEEVEEKWKERIAIAFDLQKSIGTVPKGLERFVDMILKPKIDWRNILRQCFKVGFGKSIVSTWKRPSRKNPEDFPGQVKYKIPTVWCLLDTSGSIGNGEITQFLTEVYSIAGQSNVACICWDASAYDIMKASSQNEIIHRVSRMLKGGGGTTIAPVLEKTLKHMNPRDLVVVFTDGEISDLSEDNTKMLFSYVSSKASMAVFVSTQNVVEIPSWRFIKMS